MPIRGASGSGGGGATALDDLIDVVLTAPSSLDILQYDGANWINIPSTGDWLNQYLYLPGRVGGQVLGATTHLGGSLYDLTMEGRLQLGDNISGLAYTTGRFFNVGQLSRNNTSQIAIAYSASGFTGTASGTWRGFQLTITGTAGYTGGTFTAQGMFFSATITLPAGVTGTEIVGALYQATPQETGSGTQGWNIITGSKFTALGPTTSNAGHTAALIRGVCGDVSNRAKVADLVYNFDATMNVAPSAAATLWALYGASSPNWNVGSGTFVAFYFNPLSLSATSKYGIFLNDLMTKSVLGHMLSVGKLTDPNHWLDIAAGTNAIAPLRFATGVNLTAATAGCVEWDGSRLYITDTTPTRKTIAYTTDQPSIKQTEVDFGTTPVESAEFVITDTDVSPTSQIIGSMAYEAPTGKDLDELEMDAFDLKFAPGSGQLTIFARGLDGYIADKFKINYLVG